MNCKWSSFIMLLLILSFSANIATGQYIPLSAKEAFERTEPLAKQWVEDAQLMLIGVGAEPGMNPGIYPDGKGDLWACVYYSPSKDSTYSYYATKDGPVTREAQQNHSLTPIETNWEDSDAVGPIAEQQGGSFFRENHSDEAVGAVLRWDTAYEHTDHEKWGLWWSITYWSPGTEDYLPFYFDASSLEPAPEYIIKHDQPALNQDIAFNTPGNDTLAILNFSMSELDSVIIEKIDGYYPDTTYTEKGMKQYFTITSFPESTAFECTLTLFYDQWRFDDSGISDEAGLQLYRYNGQRWELVSGTADPQKNFVTATGVTQFSKWTFANPSDQPLKVEERMEVNPQEFVLWQNYPNPFNAETIFRYQLPKESHVKLSVFNLLGQEIVRLVDKKQAVGEYQSRWSGFDFRGNQVTSGVYIVSFIADTYVESRKILLLK